MTGRTGPQSANPDAAILSERQRLLLRAIWTWEHDTPPIVPSASLPKVGDIVQVPTGAGGRRIEAVTMYPSGEVMFRVNVPVERAELEALLALPSQEEEQHLADSQVRHDYSVAPVPEYVLLAQFHRLFPIQPELRALTKLGLIERARTRGITEGCWRIDGHVFELHTHERQAPKLCVDAYLDGRLYYSYLATPEIVAERGWTLTSEGLRVAAQIELAAAGAEEQPRLDPFVPADTLAHDHGIPAPRLSEGAKAKRIRTTQAPKGMKSNGRAVRVLYHRDDAIAFAEPKHVKRGRRAKQDYPEHLDGRE